MRPLFRAGGGWIDNLVVSQNKIEDPYIEDDIEDDTILGYICLEEDRVKRKDDPKNLESQCNS